MDQGFLEMVIPMDLYYRWGAGPHLGAFLLGLKEGRILANRCPGCGRRQLPPTPVCGRCHLPMGEQMEALSTRGRVISYSFVVDPMYDAGIGGMRPVPYTVASILLDDAEDVAFFHKLQERNPSRVRVGMRVEAVFRPPDERRGSMDDILHFRTLDEGSGDSGGPYGHQAHAL